MHTNHVRISSFLTAMLALLLLIATPAAAIDDKQGGRRRGSMRNLSGNPPVQFPQFRLTVFDPDIFAATCIDPVDAANGTPGPVCLDLPGGMDHVAAGTALRNTGSGWLNLRGGPAGAVLIAARLFWSVIADESIAVEDDGRTMEVTFEGHRVIGERVGVIDELCWQTAGYSVHYSADVTGLIPGAINGSYQITGVPSSVTDGHDPFQDLENPQLPWAQGASLITIYSHPDAVGRVYLHEGAALLIDSFDLALELSPPVPPGGATVVRHTRIGGDGQTTDGEPLPVFATFLGSGPEDPTEIQIRGPGSPIDPSPDWQGQDGAPVPRLWDTQSDELWGPLLAGGAESYSLRWQAVIEAPDPVPIPLPAMTIPNKDEAPAPAPPVPPEPESLAYDCVYLGAAVMTTTY